MPNAVMKNQEIFDCKSHKSRMQSWKHSKIFDHKSHEVQMKSSKVQKIHDCNFQISKWGQQKRQKCMTAILKQPNAVKSP